MGNSLKQDAAFAMRIKGNIPVSNKYFDLSYNKREDSFLVNINFKNCKLAKNRAISYLKANNINPENYNIIWSAEKDADNSCIK